MEVDPAKYVEDDAKTDDKKPCTGKEKPPQRLGRNQSIRQYQKVADEQEQKKQQQDAADQAQKTYDALNFHDDQLDLSDAALSVAISAHSSRRLSVSAVIKPILQLFPHACV